MNCKSSCRIDGGKRGELDRDSRGRGLDQMGKGGEEDVCERWENGIETLEESYDEEEKVV